MGFGPFSSSSDTRSRVSNVNNAIAADGAVFAPRVAGGSRGSHTSGAASASGPAIAGNRNTVTTTDFGAIESALALTGQITERALQAQAALGLEAVGAARDIGLTHVSDGANLNASTTRLGLVAFGGVALVGFALWLILKR